MKGLVVIFLLIITCIVIYIILDESKKAKEEENLAEENLTEKLNDSIKESSTGNIVSELVQEFITKKPELINAVERKVIGEENLWNEINDFLKKYTLTEKQKNDVIEDFKKYIWGYGPLQELIDRDDISDIKIINENTVRIKVLGNRETSNIKFSSKSALNDYIKFVAVRNGAGVNELNAVQRITDKLSSSKFILRIDISSTFVNCVNNAYLHIRKIPKNKDSLDDLQKKGMLNTEENQYLNKAMKSNLSILVCGKGGDGKTTLINALLELIPHNRAGLIVQETEELFSNIHPDLMFQKIKEANGESNIKYTLADLIRNGLVSDNDYIVVGEIKGAEAYDCINAAYTGHVFMGSIHTINAAEAPRKMVHYMKYSPNARDMKESDLLETLAGIDIIIFMKDFKINEITEIEGFNDEKKDLKLNPVFKYKISNNCGSFVRLHDSCSKVKEKIEYSEFKNSEMVK